MSGEFSCETMVSSPDLGVKGQLLPAKNKERKKKKVADPEKSKT